MADSTSVLIEEVHKMAEKVKSMYNQGMLEELFIQALDHDVELDRWGGLGDFSLLMKSGNQDIFVCLGYVCGVCVEAVYVEDLCEDIEYDLGYLAVEYFFGRS